MWDRRARVNAQIKMMAPWQVATELGECGRIWKSIRGSAQQTASWMSGLVRSEGSFLLILTFLEHFSFPFPPSSTRRYTQASLFPAELSPSQQRTPKIQLFWLNTAAFLGFLFPASHHICFGSTSPWLYLRNVHYPPTSCVANANYMVQTSILWCLEPFQHPSISVLLHFCLPRQPATQQPRKKHYLPKL